MEIGTGTETKKEEINSFQGIQDDIKKIKWQ